MSYDDFTENKKCLCWSFSIDCWLSFDESNIKTAWLFLSLLFVWLSMQSILMWLTTFNAVDNVIPGMPRDRFVECLKLNKSDFLLFAYFFFNLVQKLVDGFNINSSINFLKSQQLRNWPKNYKNTQNNNLSWVPQS